MDWCKHDFSSRESYLEEFLAVVDFSKMSNEFIELVVLSDSELYDNQHLSNKMAKLSFGRLHETKKKIQFMEEKWTPPKTNKITLNLIAAAGIFELNWELKKWMEVLRFDNNKGVGFSASKIHSDICIAGGLQTGKKFEIYQRSLRKMSDCPPMLEDRLHHRSIQMYGKVYCCGGKKNKGPTELFDPENSKWIAGPTKEPTYGFGITSVGKFLLI